MSFVEICVNNLFVFNFCLDCFPVLASWRWWCLFRHNFLYNLYIYFFLLVLVFVLCSLDVLRFHYCGFAFQFGLRFLVFQNLVSRLLFKGLVDLIPYLFVRVFFPDYTLFVQIDCLPLSIFYDGVFDLCGWLICRSCPWKKAHSTFARCRSIMLANQGSLCRSWHPNQLSLTLRCVSICYLFMVSIL